MSSANDAPIDAPHPVDAAPDAVVAIDAAPDAVIAVDATPDAVMAIDASPDAGQAMLSVTATSIDLGAADIGKTVTYGVDVTNSGTADALVHVTTVGDRQISPGTDCFAPAGGTCTAYVQFMTYATGVFTSTVTLSSGSWMVQLPARAESYTSLYAQRWGAGTLAAPAQQISCPMGCTTRFTGDLALDATPDPGNVFVAWSDPSCGTQPSCTLHQEAAGTSVRAYFAPASPTTLMVGFVGDGDGVVDVEDVSSSQSHEIAACRTSCVVPIPTGAQIRVTAQGLSNVIGLAGACTDPARCTFTATASTMITATIQRASKEAWTREMKTTPIVSAVYDSQGNLVVVTNAFDGTSKKVIKLDPQGNTVWAHPGMDGAELALTTADGILVRNGSDVWWLTSDGYLLGYAHSFSAIDQSGVEDPHYARRMVRTPGILAGVGNTVGTQIEGAPTSAATWDRGVSVASLHKIAATASSVLVAVGNSGGGTDLVSFDYAGTQQATHTDVAPHQGTDFRVLSNGDIATVSATASQVSVRRLSGPSTVFTQDLAIADTAAPAVSLVETTGDRVFVVYGGFAPVNGAAVGYNAEIVTASGAVDWSIARPALLNVVFGGAEVYNVASNATDVAIVGAYQCISPDAGGPTTGNVIFGAGFVQTFKP